MSEGVNGLKILLVIERIISAGMRLELLPSAVSVGFAAAAAAAAATVPAVLSCYRSSCARVAAEGNRGALIGVPRCVLMFKTERPRCLLLPLPWPLHRHCKHKCKHRARKRSRILFTLTTTTTTTTHTETYEHTMAAAVHSGS